MGWLERQGGWQRYHCPSVVHLRFRNNATYSIYNDTVLFVSYLPTLNLQVKQRAVNLTQTTSSVYGINDLNTLPHS
jgi:hypothetical protein